MKTKNNTSARLLDKITNNKTDGNFNIVISWRTIAIILFILISIKVFFLISDILLMLLIASILAIAINPTVKKMEQHKISRGLSIALIFGIILALVILIFSLLIPAVSSELSVLSHNFPEFSDKVKNYFANEPFLYNVVKELFSKLSQNSSQLVSSLASITISALTAVGIFFTIMILTIYILLHSERIIQRTTLLIPDRQVREDVRIIAERISVRLGDWLRGQTILCFIIFAMVFVGLSLIGVEYALVLALIAGLFEAVPMIGAYLGAIPAIFIVLLTGDPIKLAIVAIMFIIIQQLEGNLIVPQVMKRAVGLSPLTVFVAVLIFGKLMGFFGVLIATPLASISSIVFRELFDKNDDGELDILEKDQKKESVSTST